MDSWPSSLTDSIRLHSDTNSGVILDLIICCKGNREFPQTPHQFRLMSPSHIKVALLSKAVHRPLSYYHWQTSRPRLDFARFSTRYRVCSRIQWTPCCIYLSPSLLSSPVSLSVFPGSLRPCESSTLVVCPEFFPWLDCTGMRRHAFRSPPTISRAALPPVRRQGFSAT